MTDSSRGQPAIRVVTLEEAIDLRQLERALPPDSPIRAARATTPEDVSRLLKAAKIRHRPAPDVLERLAHLIDQERLQQAIWKARKSTMLKDWKRSLQGRLAASAATFHRDLSEATEAAQRRGDVEIARKYSRLIEETSRFGPVKLTGTPWHSSALQLASGYITMIDPARGWSSVGPAVRFTQKALAHIGIEMTQSGIGRALARSRK
jgi:hypothetical protein